MIDQEQVFAIEGGRLKYEHGPIRSNGNRQALGAKVHNISQGSL